MSNHPRLPGWLAPSDLADGPSAPWAVAEVKQAFASAYIALDIESIVAPDGSTHERAIVKPHDAIGVLALDEDDRVLLVQQYRHSQQRRLLEIPAGIMDGEGESALQAAQRELAEEADLKAGEWQELVTTVVTPGYSTEQWVLFSARDLTPVAHDFVREAEEAEIEVWWLPFADALAAIADGRIRDTQTIVALYAEMARRG